MTIGIDRRRLIVGLGGAAALPLAARAQPAGRIRRVGILMPYAEGNPEYQSQVLALRQELGKLGWTDGVKIQFDERWTTDNMDRVRDNAASLLASNPDVVVAVGGRVIPVLMEISRSIPVVVPGAPDAVGVGWVKSLAKPGGNVTGFTFMELSVFGKVIEILKAMAPATTRVAMIFHPDNLSTTSYRQTVEALAGPLAVEPIMMPFHGLADIESGVASLVDRQNVSVLFPPDVTINALREDVIALVARYRLPAIYPQSVFVRSGGLAYYGADRIDLFRRAAGYVDRILRGEKAADLPFQQPTKYQLMLNLKTAKSLGLTVPPSLLAIADEVIE
jgi:putative ABC transport system substrate-binding protein